MPATTPIAKMSTPIFPADQLFTTQAYAPDLVQACYVTERNVKMTRDLYFNRGGLAALQSIVESLRGTFEAWMTSLRLTTPEAMKIVRKSLELGCFWASACFWKEQSWTHEEFRRRIRLPALWTASSWILNMLLNDELGSESTEAVTQAHKRAWHGQPAEPIPGASLHVTESLFAMVNAVQTVKQWLSEFSWAASYSSQLESAVRGYLNAQQPRTAFTTLEEFLEFRCRGCGATPVHILMAILKRDVTGLDANPTADGEVTVDKSRMSIASDSSNNTASPPQGRKIPLRLLHQCTLQATCTNDILDNQSDAVEHCPNVVNLMRSVGGKAASRSEAMRAALALHCKLTHDLLEQVRRNPNGALERQAAQVAYGCYLVEVLHPRSVHAQPTLTMTVAEAYPCANRCGKISGIRKRNRDGDLLGKQDGSNKRARPTTCAVQSMLGM
eukprot:c25745_g1_i1.p1 GENE.c25745_g1_i1~~c25745_g1_i1.p1  ORF type:complete len:443 (-),score=79.85 c25745_g1_i1:120-1448(-)